MFEMFATHGLQATLLSNNGINFTSSGVHENEWNQGHQSGTQSSFLYQSQKKTMRSWRMEVSNKIMVTGHNAPKIKRPET